MTSVVSRHHLIPYYLVSESLDNKCQDVIKVYYCLKEKYLTTKYTRFLECIFVCFMIINSTKCTDLFNRTPNS